MCRFERGVSSLSDVQQELGAPIEREPRGAGVDVLWYACQGQQVGFGFDEGTLTSMTFAFWGGDQIEACLSGSGGGM
jgi:hypothetical protein